ncbi:MAG: radical SAM protein [bacterium]|nr:radical SAM protein [bacterium]
MTKHKDVIRETRSVCPACIKDLPAEVIEEEGKIFLVKTCPEHGEFRVFLSHHPWYYRGLADFYFTLMTETYPQRDFIIRLTERCNMQCPICLAFANVDPTTDFPLEKFEEFCRDRPGKAKIDLMGAEPTIRQELPEIIRITKRYGHIAALHSNGRRLLDEAYLEELIEAGVDEVHLQFDGFDDETYVKLRGEPLVAEKIKILDLLAKHKVATDLVVTVGKGINEREIMRALNYGIAHPNVKEVFYLGCRYLGSMRENFDYTACLLPDQVIDLFVEQAGGAVSRRDIYRFQKVFFTFLRLFKVKKCFTIHHYLFVRRGNRAVPIHRLIDLEFVEKVLDCYKDDVKAGSRFALPKMVIGFVPLLFQPRTWSLLWEVLILQVLLFFGFDISKLPLNLLVLGFITACDPYFYDAGASDNCGKGEVSLDLGVQDRGAWANVHREEEDRFFDRDKVANSLPAGKDKGKKSKGKKKGKKRAKGRKQ